MHSAPPDLSRRAFLKESFAGMVCLSLGGALIPFARFNSARPIPDNLQFLSSHEFVLLQTIMERLVGRTKQDGLMPERIMIDADRYLAAEDPENQEEFHQLLTVFDAPLFTFLFDFRFSSFLNMSAHDQETYLEDWMTSAFEFRRRGFQALKRLCHGIYYADPESWDEIGYEGMFLPEDRS
jgi:hypothetical protein